MQDLIRWKTDAWKSAEMVAGYAVRMHDAAGTNRLKNEVEVELCRAHATGTTILDVGVGTGRAAIPLARDGYAVTGIDISTEMLAQCAREGAGLPLRLLPGDVTALPTGNERFDTIVSLNVVVHFPHWETIVDEWRRALAPGGRIVFDVHSRDHVEAVARATGRPVDAVIAHELADHRNFMLRIGARDVYRYARERGMSVRALVPYAAVLGGGNRNYWLDDHPLLRPAALERLLSWVGADSGVYDVARFVERIAGRATPAATGRFMVVLEDRVDPAADRAAADRIAALETAFGRGLTADDLPLLFGPDVDDVRRQAAAVTRGAAQRTFLAMLLAGARTHRALAGLVSLLPEDAALAVVRLESQRRADEAVATMTDRWSAAIPPSTRRYRGVDVCDALAYDLTRAWCAATWFAVPEPVLE